MGRIVLFQCRGKRGRKKPEQKMGWVAARLKSVPTATIPGKGGLKNFNEYTPTHLRASSVLIGISIDRGLNYVLDQGGL